MVTPTPMERQGTRSRVTGVTLSLVPAMTCAPRSPDRLLPGESPPVKVLEHMCDRYRNTELESNTYFEI